MLAMPSGFGYSTASFLKERGQIAQLVEQGIENPRVGGSIPSLATMCFNRLADFWFWQF